MKIQRSIDTPIRNFIDMDHRWHGADDGLIWCWESGREMVQLNPQLAERARLGELMILTWKGGITPGVKMKHKEGTFKYLAQWQGLAGKDLELDTDVPITLICTKTGINVTYSKDGWKAVENNGSSFIALDVETANEKRASICSIGLVFFQDNQIVDQKHYLINPQEEFAEFNIKIHGIAPEHVIQSPTFPQIESELRTFLTGQIIVSHSEFDSQALSKNLKKYKFPPIEFSSWVNSCEVARDIFPNLRNYKLKTIAKRMKISLNHHDALDDARVAGLIIVERNSQI